MLCPNLDVHKEVPASMAASCNRKAPHHKCRCRQVLYLHKLWPRVSLRHAPPHCSHNQPHTVTATATDTATDTDTATATHRRTDAQTQPRPQPHSHARSVREGAAPTVDTCCAARGGAQQPRNGVQERCSQPPGLWRRGYLAVRTAHDWPHSDGGYSTSGFEPMMDANGIATELKLATSGGRVRLEGSNFGFCPEVRLSIDGARIVYTLAYCLVDPTTNTLVDVTGDATWSEFTLARGWSSTSHLDRARRGCSRWRRRRRCRWCR